FNGGCAFLFAVAVLLADARRADGWDRPLLKQRGRQLLVLGLPVFGAFVLLERSYQWYRFGSPWNNYIHAQNMHMRAHFPDLPPEWPFSGPFWEGFLGPLIRPDVCIFFFDPLLMVLLFLGVSCRRSWPTSIKAVLAALVFLLLLMLCLHARLVWWSGHIAWGA